MKRKREEADAEAYQKTVKSAFKFKGGGSLSKKSKKKKKRKKKSASAAEGADPADFFHAPVEVDAAAAIKKQKEEAKQKRKESSSWPSKIYCFASICPPLFIRICIALCAVFHC